VHFVGFFFNYENARSKKQNYSNSFNAFKSKGLLRQAEVVQGVPGRLRAHFGTTRVVGRQPNAPAAFIPEEIPGIQFQKLSRPQGTWFCWGYHGKKSPVTRPGIYPWTSRLVAQCLNHYATPDLLSMLLQNQKC